MVFPGLLKELSIVLLGTLRDFDVDSLEVLLHQGGDQGWRGIARFGNERRKKPEGATNRQNMGDRFSPFLLNQHDALGRPGLFFRRWL